MSRPHQNHTFLCKLTLNIFLFLVPLTSLFPAEPILTGKWYPVTPPAAPNMVRLTRISFAPVDHTGGIRYSENSTPVFATFPGHSPAPSIEDPKTFHQLLLDPEGLSLTISDEDRTLQTRSLRLADDNSTLLIAATTYSPTGQTATEGYLYRRAPASECNVPLDSAPPNPFYGCWIWPDGLRALARQLEPISIEMSSAGLRLVSPSQTLVLRKGGPITHLKRTKQFIEFTIAAGPNEKAAGTMRLELTPKGELSVTVNNTNGITSSYTYRKRLSR